MKIELPAVNSRVATIPTDTVKQSGILDKAKKEFKHSQLLAISSTRASNINDAKAVFDMLPDIYYASDVMISETLSPKDLAPPKMNIIFDSPEELEFGDTDVIAELNRYFGEGGIIDIESNLYKWLEEALVTTGTVPIMVMKPNDIDKVIKQLASAKEEEYKFTIETARTSATTVTNRLVKESKELLDCGITVTDNPNILRSTSIEEADYERMVSQLGYETKRSKSVTFSSGLRYADDNSLSEPIYFKLPPESVIPVFVKGEPEKHLGYYIPLVKGYPVSHQKDSSEYDILKRRIKTLLKGSEQKYKSIVEWGKAAREENEEVTAEDYMNAFSNKMKEELEQAMDKRFTSREVAIANNDDAWTLMFHSVLAKQEIDMLYVPAQAITYIAFDYDSRGVGVSKLEKTKLFSTLRATLMMAEVFAGVKNSIPLTRVNMQLDDEDSDPYYTAEVVKDRISKMVSGSFSVGAIQASDIMDSLLKSSVYMDIEGGTAFPGTKVSLEDTNRQMAKTDSELKEELKKMHLSGFGSSPEKVDRALEGEYAISTATTNSLDSRRIAMRQKTYCKHISHLIQNIIRLSPKLSTMLQAINTDMDFESLLRCVKFKLPGAELNQMDINIQRFQQAQEYYTGVVEVALSEDMYRDLLQGQYVSGSLDSMRQAYTNYLLSQWCKEEGILPEVFNLTSDDNTELIDGLTEHLTRTIEVMGKVLKKTYKEEAKQDKAIQKVLDSVDGGAGGGDNFGGGGDADTGGIEDPAGEPDEGGTGEDEDIFAGDDPNAGAGDVDDEGGDDPALEEDETGEGDTGGDEVPEPDPEGDL